MNMVATWRLGVAGLCALGAYLFTERALVMLLQAIRRRAGKRFRWIGDLQRHLVVHLAWILIALMMIGIAVSILGVRGDSNVVQGIVYLMAIPVVLGTFALRIVATNMFIRHFKWDRGSHEFDVKIFVVTEGFKFLCFFLICVEIFFIFFHANTVAGFLLTEVTVGIELLLILGGFTVLKNVSTGLFLVFAEPFRTGSYCKVLQFSGFIDRVSLARTTMRRYDGSHVFLPNGIFADTHQTNGNPTDAYRHELLLPLHPTTPLQTIRSIRTSLEERLSYFAEDTDDDASTQLPGSRDSRDGYALTPGAPALEARQSSGVSSEADHMQKRLRIVFHDLHTLSISIAIKRVLFATLEGAKTEVNLCIIDTLHQHTKAANLGVS